MRLGTAGLDGGGCTCAQDNDRCGILPFVFDDDFGFERYAEYAMDVPMYFVYRSAPSFS